MATSDDKTTEIHETQEFMDEIGKHISEHELAALRYYLAANPYAGEPSQEYPGMIVLEWGQDGDIAIYYLVSNDRKAIYLTWVTGKDQSLPSAESPDGQKAKKTIEKLKRYGIGWALRELWEQLSKIPDNWPF